jgi:hypothetical protein
MAIVPEIAPFSALSVNDRGLGDGQRAGVTEN